MRFGAFFIGLCMAIIAAAVGAVAYLALGLSSGESLASGVTALSLLTAYNAFSARARERADLAQRIADLSRGTADLARQVGDLGRRVLAAEAALAQIEERTRQATDPLASEMEVVGTLVKQLAESVAAHESLLLGGAVAAPSIAPGAVPPGEPETPPAAPAAPSPAASAAPTAGPSAESGGAAATRASAELLGIVRGALESNRVDLYLQPIVTLPQRKVRYYEATTRLRTEEGGLLLPADYLNPAESGGLMPLLDNLMLFRSVQVVRRLTSRNREAGLFCNIAGSTLADAEFFAQFFEFLSANRAFAPWLVFEFAQATLRAMGPIEHESLAQLAELGFRFSLDQVTDLQIEPRALAEQGFRFVKVPAPLLLNRAVPASADIHPSDLSNLLSRYGIELIVEKIETEGTVVDLLDYDVRLGQGYLFAPPRPVRSEVFQSAAERPAPAPAAAAPQPRPEPAANRPAAAPPPQRPSEGETSGLAKLARAFARKV
ncbi:MAG: EAL domain-containing protein [Variibacter sp.]|nr:EAL domain-containing protein [Variibacter sp.]